MAQKVASRQSASPAVRPQKLEHIDFDLLQTEVRDELRRSIDPTMLSPPISDDKRKKREVKAGRKKGPRTRSNANASDSATPNRQTIMPMPFMAPESSIGVISESSFDAAELLSQLEKSYQECDTLKSERDKAEQI